MYHSSDPSLWRSVFETMVEHMTAARDSMWKLLSFGGVNTGSLWCSVFETMVEHVTAARD